MSIITLTTDFGLKDYFVGATKGKILSLLPSVQIIDISHQIDKFNIAEAAYCITYTYANFPNGSIHIIDIDSERTPDTQHIAMQWDNHYFICADNGILSEFIHQKKPQQLVALINFNELPENISNMDIFIHAAFLINQGKELYDIGNPIDNLKKSSALVPQVLDEKNTIKGQIIYIDDFGNCVTNIHKTLFLEIAQNRNFEIKFRNKTINRIHKSFSDFKVTETFPLYNFEGEKLAIFNENNLLEIAIYKSNSSTFGSAKTLLGLQFRDIVTINFID